MRGISLVPVLVLFAAAAAGAPKDVPKADVSVINLVNSAGKWQEVHDRVRPLILEHGKEKDEAKRAALTERIVSEFGKPAIEVLIRYREPNLVPVFSKLCEAQDWYVRRLAIFGLQRNFGFSALDRIVLLTGDDNPLVREIAATTTAILHHAAVKHRELIPKGLEPADKEVLKNLGKRRKDDLKVLTVRHGVEENPFVKSAIAAAVEVMGKRSLLLIHTEPVKEAPPGRYVPRLEGGEVNAYQTGSGISSAGAGKLAPTKGWAYPVLLYPREVFSTTSDTPLVPLPEKRNSYHYGHDCGWFLEGSGIYAIADGVIRWIRSGGDWGGLIVGEYMAEDRSKVTALNGHCGMWVFVEGGEAVKAGQLIGQMGLSFSAENGGHGAHDHFGMFSGGFVEGHCYGRGTQDRTADGWLVPADFLTPKVDGGKIAPDSYR
ncbi:MAG: hypothetical protein MUE73_02715 [Planctomycetes bacterium]|jgi:hypothetical protein|nr:hypothetical protein [Planctomycetota bacterium]